MASQNVGKRAHISLIDPVTSIIAPQLSASQSIIPLQSSSHQHLYNMAPQAEHPDRDFWKTEVERIGNVATTDKKLDAAQTSVEFADEGQAKIAATPFEEKTEAERKLVRKIDMYLMPTIWILYCFSYMVRSGLIQGLILYSLSRRTALPSATPKSLVWTLILTSRLTNTSLQS